MPLTLEQFLTSTPEARLKILKNDPHAPEVESYLGARAFAEYRALAAAADLDHLGGAPRNLIFVPGVMGSLLKSEAKGGIWWVDVRTRNHIDDLRLSADGTSDANGDDEITPCSIDPSYEPFLTAVINRDDFGHRVFPYDWRKSLRLSTEGLKNTIEHLHATNGGREVHLVGHSMGGLLIRATIHRFGDELATKLGRIVFIGTPHYGSPAIASYLKNHFWGFDLMAILGAYLSTETYRSMRGVLSLLPAPAGIYPGTRPDDDPKFAGDAQDPYVHPCGNFDFYDAGAWALDLGSDATRQLQEILDDAAEFHSEMDGAHRRLDQSVRDKMLMIAGVGFKTLFRLENTQQFFGIWDRMRKITDRSPGNPDREGDGRVPLASAKIPNVKTRYVRGVHGALPNIKAVYEETFRWLNGDTLELPETAGDALSEHLSAGAYSTSPHLDGTATMTLAGDDPGIWNLAPPSAVAMKELRDRLENNELQEFNRIRIL